MLNTYILGILDIDAVMLMIKAGQCLLPLVLAQCSIIAHSEHQGPWERGHGDSGGRGDN